MRKVTYHIDDIEYLREKYSVPEEIIESIDNGFVAILTFIGEGMFPDKYIMTNKDGTPININSLNGYQKGCIYNDLGFDIGLEDVNGVLASIDKKLEPVVENKLRQFMYMFVEE